MGKGGGGWEVKGKGKRGSFENLLSPVGPLGKPFNGDITGIVPVFSIFSSNFSCSNAANSDSNSSSSIGSVMGMEVMALPISCVSSCCSRSCSLEKYIMSGC